MKCLKCLATITEIGHYGLHRECFLSWFKVTDTYEFVSLTRRSSDSQKNLSTPNTSTQNTSFFHGKFKKYSADLAGASYILKMKEDEAEELPQVEYLCNQIAQKLGIPVADFYFVDFEGEKVFVTKNFIKKGVPSDLQHIYHHRPDEKHDCETLIDIVAKKTNRLYDVRVLIHTILFDALIGNHDRHGRNLAFIVTSGNNVLSPIYDNVSGLALEKGPMLKMQFNPLGKIATEKTTEPSIKDYVEDLYRLGYGEVVKEFFDKIDLKEIERLIEDSFCSGLMKDAIRKLFKNRYEEFGNEVKSR
jgi:hypothetical protein